MDGNDLIYGLQFTYDLIFHQDIHTKAIIQLNTVIDNRITDLTTIIQTSFVELITKTRFINTFEQAGPQSLTNRKSRIHDLGRNLLRFLRNRFIACMPVYARVVSKNSLCLRVFVVHFFCPS